MIDFAPETPENSSLNSQLRKAILGKEDQSFFSLLREFGLGFWHKEKLKKVFEKYPKVALVYGAIESLKTHGEKVGKTMENIWAKFGLTSKPQIYPLQSLINPQLVQFGQDELGNSTFSYELEPKPLIKIIKGSSQKVINLSLQIGEVGFTYEEKWLAPQARQTSSGDYEEYTVVQTNEYPEVKINDAYTSDKAEANLTKLFEICAAFPEKLIVTAGGNYHDDVRGARKTLADQWPPNLLLVAEWNGNSRLNRPENYVYGADIYVDNQSMGLTKGSSLSAPVISALASIFVSQGLRC